MNEKRMSVSVAAMVAGVCIMVGAVGETRAANDHFIAVTVDPDGRVIEVDVPELRVRGRNHNIFWTIQNAPKQSYSFPEDGIEFKTEAGRREFKCMRQNRTKFKCHDKGETKGRFEYGVKLTGTPSVPVLDPFVVNN